MWELQAQGEVEEKAEGGKMQANVLAGSLLLWASLQEIPKFRQQFFFFFLKQLNGGMFYVWWKSPISSLHFSDV